MPVPDEKELPPSPAEKVLPPQVIIAPVVVVPVIVPVSVPAPALETPRAEAACGNVPAAPENPSFFPPPPRAAPKSLFGHFFGKIGGAGFLASVLFHGALMIFAIFWVFAESVVPAEADSVFVSGSGGASASGAGTRGEFSAKVFRKAPAPAASPKIISSGKNAKIALPEASAMLGNAGVSLRSAFGGNAGLGGDGNGADAAGASGFGGGIGAGTGIGIGGGKNHLGKFKMLLGAKVEARRIAVYLDCSGSMKPYLDAVKAEIYEKFPDADVFAYSGAQTEIHDGCVVGGKDFKAKQLAALKKKPAEDETDSARLSSQGRAIHRKYAAHFRAGTLGAWLDVLSRERYDALVVFSDFRDGARQRRGGKTVFADSSYSPTPDARDARERKWEADWRSAFARSGAPKLYLFSAGTRPQAFLEACVSASGGEIAFPELKSGGVSRRKKTGAGMRDSP